MDVIGIFLFSFLITQFAFLSFTRLLYIIVILKNNRENYQEKYILKLSWIGEMAQHLGVLV